ncbi:MAG: zinc-ribbon domain containing protein [Dehalococcoidia bacterium]|nr:MAG: zinc-ribbon domain containing protein [Dehalococcoidia bacterium]
MTDGKIEETFKDKYITCKECSDEFVFSAGEQRFFKEKGLTDALRCKSCIRIRKLNIR